MCVCVCVCVCEQTQLECALDSKMSSFQRWLSILYTNVEFRTNQKFLVYRYTCVFNKNMCFVLRVILVHLQSSPTGPAEHCAGGSLPKSCNSYVRETDRVCVCEGEEGEGGGEE